MNFIEELNWRGMIHDMMPGIEEELSKGMRSGYIGFDPTSDSLHIGSLVQIMTLVHFQKFGHKPLILIGGATGMVGDPSGKSQERNLLSEDVLLSNVAACSHQLEKFLNFNCGENSAEVVNNYDWFKHMNFLDFIRDTGKHITVNYMMSKDSVKSRLETGLSFTEFTYQLVQGYDFYWLYKNRKCVVQLGGSDQWGNIVTGTELIRRKANGQAWAVTTPLIKKADGSKFGKTEGGNIWLDKNKTTVRDFYQYWLNLSDTDSENYIKIFTLLSKSEIDNIIANHRLDPDKKELQKILAKDITIRVHSEADFLALGLENNIMFDKNIGKVEMENMPKNDLLSALQSYDLCEIDKAQSIESIDVIDFLTIATRGTIYQSKGEARRAIEQNAVSINKEKVSKDAKIQSSDFIHGEILLVSKGKKKHFVVKK